MGAAVVASALAFAVEGGEFGTSDLWRLKVRRAEMVHALDSLAREVDSLTKYRKRVQSDPDEQERIAREEFGMVRGDKELLYRFVEGDSGQRAEDSAAGRKDP